MSIILNGTTGITTPDVSVTAQSTAAITANRLSSDGTIIDVQKNGTTVGSIGNTGGNLYIQGSTSTGKMGLEFGGTALYPRDGGTATDGSNDFGDATYRWRNLYLSGGVYVGGTAAANKLDDYEVGNIEVTVSATTGTPTIAASENNIRYVKIGDAVVISGQLGTINCSGCGGALFVDLGIVTPSLLTDRSEYQSILARCGSASYPIVELYNTGGTSVWLIRAWSGSGSFDANAAAAFASAGGTLDINLGGGCSFVTA